MNILIVDGNEKEASERYTKMGMDTQYEVYKNVLENLSNNNLNISVVHPAIKDQYLPLGVSLDDFHVYLSEDNPGNTAKSPGQYNRNDEVSTGDLDFTLDRTSDDSSFWIIVHGVACY